MKKRFSVEQITAVLKQAENGTPILELCRQHGFAEQSFYRWKKLYAGIETSELRELRQPWVSGLRYCIEGGM
jgi:putative transposase